DWIKTNAFPGTGCGVLYVDGTVIDTNLTVHYVDPFNNQDDIFAGGDKVNDNPNTWAWTTGTVTNTPKDNINHALVHIAKDASNHTWLIVSADRQSGSGNSFIDFEFLQNPLILTNNPGTTNGGGFFSDGPNCGRTTNDFILTLQFQN